MNNEQLIECFIVAELCVCPYCSLLFLLYFCKLYLFIKHLDLPINILQIK